MAPQKLQFLAALHANRNNKGPANTVDIWFDDLLTHFDPFMPTFKVASFADLDVLRKQWISDRLDEISGHKNGV